MTIDEAIKHGQEQLEIFGGEHGEFIKVAIKALEQEPTTKNDLGVDCISRKAALDITWQDPSYSDPLNVLTEVRDKIRELPSVTPQEPKTGHRVSGDLLGGLYCSECMTCLKDYFNYCPNCGAKMTETEDT